MYAQTETETMGKDAERSTETQNRLITTQTAKTRTQR